MTGTRTWIDGCSRLDIERDPSGRVRIGLHAVDDAGVIVQYGYVASFAADAQTEIAEFITEAK